MTYLVAASDSRCLSRRSAESCISVSCEKLHHADNWNTIVFHLENEVVSMIAYQIVHQERGKLIK